jgi:hypothetical protein
MLIRLHICYERKTLRRKAEIEEEKSNKAPLGPKMQFCFFIFFCANVFLYIFQFITFAIFEK